MVSETEAQPTGHDRREEERTMAKSTTTMTAPRSGHAHSATRTITRTITRTAIPAFPITASRPTAVTDPGSGSARSTTDPAPGDAPPGSGPSLRR